MKYQNGNRYDLQIFKAAKQVRRARIMYAVVTVAGILVLAILCGGIGVPTPLAFLIGFAWTFWRVRRS